MRFVHLDSDADRCAVVQTLFGVQPAACEIGERGAHLLRRVSTQRVHILLHPVPAVTLR